MPKKMITISVFNEVDTHIIGISGDYATLCGMDGDDPDRGVQQLTLKETGGKITCRTCKQVWDTCRKIKPSMFNT